MVLRTNQDNVLPLSKPVIGLDGTEIHEILVPKNTYVNVSILHFNTNPEIWGPDSAEWKPERWLSPLPETVKGTLNTGVYSHL